MKKLKIIILFIIVFILFKTTVVNAEDGWVKEEDNTYYYKDNMVLTGIQTLDNHLYYFGEDGKLETGFIEDSGKTYFFSRTYGYALKGWVRSTVGEGTWYQQEDGTLLKGIQTLDNHLYYFGEDGKLETGFIEDSGKTYFFSRTYGYALKGWVRSTVGEGTWYQQEDGTLLKGIQTLDNHLYHFGEDGKLEGGFVEDSGKTYFFSRTYGYALKGWVRSTVGEGTWYQQEDGTLLKGIQTLDNHLYYFGEDGKLEGGFVEDSGKIYFFSRTYGYALKGWVRSTVGEGTWYQQEDGSLLMGSHTIDGKKYYFGEDGKIKTGFIKENGKIYFYSRTYNYALKGWVSNQDGVWYQEDDGSLRTGASTIDGRDYVFNSETGLLDGFVEANGKTYYYNPDGTLNKGIQYIGNKYWKFNDETGAFEKIVRQIRVIDISRHNGNINWDQVKASGTVDAVILRLGYGDRWLDDRFLQNKEELERLGIPYSVYLFSYAENSREALAESNFVINTIKNNKVNIASNIFSIYYDLEDWVVRSTGENSYGISKGTYGEMITTFVDNVEKNLCIKARVYASEYYVYNRFPEYTYKYATWIANWTQRGITYPYNYEGWQYTSSGSVPGISGNVDMNIFYY